MHSAVAAANIGPVVAPAIDTDVLVIGGGPGGSTAAALLAERGWRVLLLDKDRHPRFHIGESLLPMSLPMFDRMGVGQAIERVGLIKRAVEFHSMDHDAAQLFPFSAGWAGTPAYAYQVRRSEFDHALLNHARACGADVREGHKVNDLQFEPTRVLAQARRDDGAVLTVHTRYVVDASGRDTFMASRLKIKRRNPKHTSAALYGHFRGARRNSGEDEGNINVYWFDHGWIWFIPLADGSTSVGAVCWPYYLKSRDTDPSSFFLRTLQMCPPLWERVRDATLIEPATATGNYSYTSDRMAGDRYVMVGDAFAFVDPVFSSGVYLAMNSAQFATEVIDGVLRDPSRAAALNRAFEARVRRGLKSFTWMIFRMPSPVMRDMIMRPLNPFGVKSAAISFLAGDVYDPGPVRRRMLLFRAIYAIQVLFSPRRAWRGWRTRQHNIVPQPIHATDGSG